MTSTAISHPRGWKHILHSPQQRLSLILWLVAVHSFFVGAGLIVLPDDWFPFFGFTAGGERFFRAQAGVFHFVMVVVYVMAAFRCAASSDATYIAIGAKFLATVFLFTYYLFVEPVWMVLLSGLSDGALGVLILWGCLTCRAYTRAPGVEPAGEEQIV